MKRLVISSVVVVGGLTGCAADRMEGRSAGRISEEFLLLLLVAVVLYLAFSGVVALVARRSPRTGQSFDLVAGRAVPRSTHSHFARHRRDRRMSAKSGGGPDGAIPGDAPTAEPDRRRPAP
jgi:hypothetical protein